MCGISGIVNQKNKKVSSDKLTTMNNLIAHRGPDDEGFYFADNVAFGHRRLSILDLSNEGHQPMHYQKKYTITYNGEIYNYLEIREFLVEKGYIFHSHTDTEVILAAYDFWEEKCVNHFNGMWAFALYDKQRNILFCSRDRFGIKPFYYTQIENQFIFGSELKQLLVFYEKRYVNKSVLMEYLVFNLEEHSDETFFQNIFKLPQSHNLIYDLSQHTYEVEKYYTIEINPDYLDREEDELIKMYEKVFYASIDLRLRADVKVGTCLSGGLDSSAIAAIASRIYHTKTEDKFIAIHAKSIEQSTDESQFAQVVSKHCKLNLKMIEPSNEDFFQYINEIIYTQEEPFGGPSVFMQYFVMQKAKIENCKVMLDGQGGDETLLGYNRYYVLFLRMSKWKFLFENIKNIKDKSAQTIFQIAYYYVGMTFTSLRIYFHKREYKFLKLEEIKSLDTKIVEKIIKHSKNDRELQELEIMATNIPMLLKYEDKNSMRNSIETRLPFLDYNCVATAVSLPIQLKLKLGWSKYVLRKIMESILPFSIVWRKQKFGFEAPTSIWLHVYSSEIDTAIMNSTIIKKLTNKVNLQKLNKRQKWKLFNIAKWEEIYDVKLK